MQVAISELLSALSEDLSREQGAETAVNLINVIASPDDVAKNWIAALNRDSYDNWPSALVRIGVFLALLNEFERLRVEDYRGLQEGLRNFTSRSGRPLTVAGTRYELASRAAAALYQKGRRTPGEYKSVLMLVVAEQLFSLLLNESRQKDNPQFAKQWFGMRGVSRLMLATQRPDLMPTPPRNQFAFAASDLQQSYQLGNRGESAATFLLDAHLHIYELDKSIQVTKAIDEVIESLPVEDTKNRSAMALIGQYWFYRSFYEENSSSRLNSAIAALDEALTYPPRLAHDDCFVRLIRGQALVRLAIAERSFDLHQQLHSLSKAIDDLKFSFESSPERFGDRRELPSALVSRSEIHARMRNYAAVREDLEYLLRHPELRRADPAMASQAEFAILQLPLKEALDLNDIDCIERILPQILAHDKCTSQGTLITALAVKRLFNTKSDLHDSTLLRKSIQIMRATDAGSIVDSTASRMHYSILAGLLTTLGAKWDPDVLDEAAEMYAKAIDASAELPPAELLAMFGDCLLRLGKHCLRQDRGDERIIDLLQRAGDTLLSAASRAEQSPDLVHESFKLVVTMSKAGEAFHRMFALTGTEEDGWTAIDCFKRAQDLGNNSHEIQGLLGDAYYRLFRLRREPDLLRLAALHKEKAREAGGASRENLSFSARLAITQWEFSGVHEDLLSAIALVSRAHEASPDWPWPPFQLSELLDRVEPEKLQKTLVALDESDAALKLVQLVKQKGAAELIDLGTTLVIENEEFAKHNLGGRQPVYVLQDEHGLMSTSYVFKHIDKANALRDRSTIDEFGRFLEDNSIRGLRLPRPLAIIPQKKSSSVVYVMRRATGFHLGRLAARARLLGQDPPLAEFRRALGYLAAFHAWGETAIGLRRCTLTSFVYNTLAEVLGHKIQEIEPSTKELLEQAGSIPLFVKKDAHPENWLIDDHNNLAMIDFESRKPLPVLFEAVQLLDDYPVVSADSEGWTTRMTMCSEYLASYSGLKRDESPLDVRSVDVLYGCFAVIRCAFGIKRAGRKSTVSTSSSTLRAKGTRLDHYRDLLDFLANDHAQLGLRRLAVAVQSDIKALV